MSPGIDRKPRLGTENTQSLDGAFGHLPLGTFEYRLERLRSERSSIAR